MATSSLTQIKLASFLLFELSVITLQEIFSKVDHLKTCSELIAAQVLQSFSFSFCLESFGIRRMFFCSSLQLADTLLSLTLFVHNSVFALTCSGIHFAFNLNAPKKHIIIHSLNLSNVILYNFISQHYGLDASTTFSTLTPMQLPCFCLETAKS